MIALPTYFFLFSVLRRWSIVVEGRVFKAHRNVLFAGSGYFRALLVHYLQDSGQRHSTASLDIVTAEAFSAILDFLYSGRLDLGSDNVIEVMSAASYLQMTDVVSFCKGYIRSSLEICNREKERERERDVEKEREGPADSGTAALPPLSSSSCEAVSGPSLIQERAPTGGSDIPLSSVTDPPALGAAPPSLPTPPGHPTPPGPGRDSESDCSSRGEFPSHTGGRPQRAHQSDPTSSSPPGLTLGLVHPKIEYDPDDEPEEGSPDTKDLALFMGPPLHHHNLHDRLPSSSPSPSSERSSLGFGGCHARQFMDVLLRGSSSPHRDRGEHGQMFVPGMGLGVGGGRVDEGLGMGGSSIMEIQSDWYGEDTGDGLLVPVKLHKCPYCPYTAKQKGILKRHIRCHTGERPFPCQTCGKRFTRQEHLRSHSLSVHRSSWPVVCKGCRRSFSGPLSHGLKRFGLCDNCTCVTTTGHDNSPPAHINLSGQPEPMERVDGDGDWPSFMDEGEELEARGGVTEELGDKTDLHRRLADIPSAEMKGRRHEKEEFNFRTQY
ncbi:hypothetical protein UPYG_G00331110 [Umbra pygmaea]|uniref:Zinc finger and BTB domain-containing protein 8B n=1 Tax=Umbra pygmaea TaxID=75934 RepID=A0ABD0VWI1_UMBPY